ncbi:MAG: SDR family NAD(P)-dependent oxidoreductase [Fibrobacteria bacterium]|nr:SDR family NAD(P)-dependent oxidoreductase [Fibrobacteria bacterium]
MRLALITGGSRGLGSALCHQYLQDGWTVLEFSRSAPHSFSRPLDLSAPETVATTVKESQEGLPHDAIEELVAIHNAGDVSPITSVAHLDSARVLGSLHANLAGGILFLSTVVDHFAGLPGSKRLANISSGAALKGYAGWSLYCACKGGMEQFVRSLAAEQKHRPHPFLAVNIDPGVMDTSMQATIRASSPKDFPDLPRFVGLKEQGALADPARTARAVRRILSLESLSGGERHATKDHPVD